MPSLGAPIDQDLDPGQVSGRFACAERDDRRDILGLAEPLDRRRLHQVACAVILLQSPHRGIEAPWRDGNDPGSPLAEAGRKENGCTEGSRVALDVIGNVRATEAAIAALADRSLTITVGDIEDLEHARTERAIVQLAASSG